MESNTSESQDSWEERLMGEVLLLGFLSKAIQSYPEREWLQSLNDEEMFMETPWGNQSGDITTGLSLLQSWSKKNQKEISEDSLQDLKSDYTRLFIGMGKVLAPPWESVYFSEERLVFQEQTLQVRNWYRRFGLESESIYKEPDDHIGLEMSFVSYLSSLALKALEEGDDQKYLELIEAQHQFLSEHLLKWGPYWCGLVLENCRTDFYKGLAYLTRGALLSLAAQFDIPTSKEVIR